MSQPFRRYLTRSEETALLSTIDKLKSVLARRDFAWISLIRQTGVRVGALSQLTVADAKEGLRTQHLMLRPEIQKGGRAHSVYLTKPARSALRQLLAIRKEQGHPQKPDAPLLMSRNHNRLSVRSLQHRFRKWCKEANIPVEATPHWMRHTCAKRVIDSSTASNPLGIVQHVLGHATLASTGIYTQPDREQIAAAMEESTS